MQCNLGQEYKVVSLFAKFYSSFRIDVFSIRLEQRIIYSVQK